MPTSNGTTTGEKSADSKKAVPIIIPADDEDMSSFADPVEIPPPEAVSDPGIFARFIVTEETIAVSGAAAVVEVKKPENGTFFRTHPDQAMTAQIWVYIQRTGGKRLYLIDPELTNLPEVEGLTSRYTFVPYVTQFGSLGLWAIATEHDELAWIKSALQACDLARDSWIAANTNKKQQQYRIQPASRDFGKPQFPEHMKTIYDYLKLAFRDEDMILDRDHPALKRLRGEV